jgi:NAD(P)-dependent dehydrogenase (short-subunit alcohol dehydrogenase family)
LYGNFGQSNYGAAKSGMLGLMNVLAIEGAKFDIRANMLTPTAATRMTEKLLSEDVLALLQPETITPGVLALVSQNAPTKMILGAGAGVFAEVQIRETPGVALSDTELSPEAVLDAMPHIRNTDGAAVIEHAFAQTRKFARMAAAKRDLPLPWND